MASTAKVAYTARSIQSLDNEQLLKLLELTGRDITRRVRNYCAATEPAALLDGLKFAARADDIAMDLMHGDCRSISDPAWTWSLHHAKTTLTNRLAGTSFDDADDDTLDGIDLDG